MVKNAISEPPNSIDLEQPARGRVSVRRLDWDSDFFGDVMGIVKVEIARETADRAEAAASLLTQAARKAREAGFGHLICRTDGDDWPFAHGGQRAGWLIVDVATDLVCTPPARTTTRRGRSPHVRDAQTADLPALEALAGGAFTFSRFVADPYFSPAQVEAFRRRWAHNLATGLAQSVFVYEDNGTIAGFIAMSLTGESSRIVLVAAAADLRARGVGSALVDAGLAWASEAGAAATYVKTQSANIAALRLYARAGFLPHRCEITLSTDLRASQAG